MPHKNYTCITVRKDEYKVLKEAADELGVSVRELVKDMARLLKNPSRPRVDYDERNDILYIEIASGESDGLVEIASGENWAIDAEVDKEGKILELIIWNLSKIRINDEYKPTSHARGVKEASSPSSP